MLRIKSISIIVVTALIAPVPSLAQPSKGSEKNGGKSNSIVPAYLEISGYDGRSCVSQIRP